MLLLSPLRDMLRKLNYAHKLRGDAPTVSPSKRFHELDALRSFAMLSGIVLHATFFLIPPGWKHQTPDPPDNIYWIAMNAIHGFRMPVFFVLSGFFTAMLWERFGVGYMVSHRLKRIGLPLAVGCFTVIPAIAWAGQGSDFQFQEWPFIWLDTLYHLWFLWVLSWLCLGFVALACCGVRFTHPVLWWLLIPLTLVSQLQMEWLIVGPDTFTGLLPQPETLGYYGCFFFFGTYFFRSRFMIQRWWALGLLLALFPVFPVALGLLVVAQERAWALPVSGALQVAFAWLMCFGAMGLFHWIFLRERIWVRYVADSSYWLYLWHLPLIVFAQRWMRYWPLNDHLKFALMCLVVTAMLIASYHVLVRYTYIGVVLHGRRERAHTLER